MTRQQTGQHDVLIISQVPPPVHGSSLMTLKLRSVLEDEDLRVATLSRNFSSSVSEVGVFSFRKVRRALQLAAALWRFNLTSPGSVCIFFVTNRSFSFVVDLGLALILRLKRVATIHYVHTSGWQRLAEKNIWSRRLVAWLFATAARVVVLSKSLVEDVDRASGASRGITVIPNTVDMAEAELCLGARSTILFLSNLLPEKGVSDFIQLAADVNAVLPGYKFIAAGAGSDEQIAAVRRAVEEAGLESCFDYVGQVDPAAKSALFADAAMFIFPSRYKYEAQPLVVLEALSAGVPVGAYRVGSLEDVLLDCDGALVAEPGDIKTMARWVVATLQDPCLHLKRSLSARELYETSFSPEVYADAWRELLADVRGVAA